MPAVPIQTAPPFYPYQPEHINALVVWLDVAQIVLWFSLVVICLYGFSGCMMKRFIWVDWFYDLAWWHLWINVILGIYTLTWINLPASKDIAVGICLKATLSTVSEYADGDDLEKIGTALKVALIACVGNLKLSLLVLDFCWTIAILIQLYLVLVIAHYLDELADLEAAQKYNVDIENATPPFSFPETEQDPLFQVRRSKRF
ncbi:hypothetical protein JCM6882_000787 [Rhodosporidiobolus microsporus]